MLLQGFDAISTMLQACNAILGFQCYFRVPILLQGFDAISTMLQACNAILGFQCYFRVPMLP